MPRRSAVSSHLDVDDIVVRRNANSMFHSEEAMPQESQETRAIAGWIIRHELEQAQPVLVHHINIRRTYVLT